VLGACSFLPGENGEQEMNETDREGLLQRSNKMADEGLRVIALAQKTVGDSGENPYTNLTFLALVGLLDPPRSDVKEALKSCEKAGIRVVMLTGDQPLTARNVALSVGLIDDPSTEPLQGSELKEASELTEEERKHLLNAAIFARVTPEQKLRLVDLHQQGGAVIAMTGDGVNDAPALKKADIGIAMGQRGTQVAKEAADMVLKDDAFSTIVTAVCQGRVIFQNIRKFVFYLLSCNVSEIMVVALASIVGAPLPVLPLQILFLNLVTDVFPALALGVSKDDPVVMTRPPRNPQEPIVAFGEWLAIGGYGFAITVSVLAALALALLSCGMPERQAVTVSFLTLAFAQLWHVFNMRAHTSSFFRNEITSNAFVWGALGLCSGLLLIAVYVPVLSKVLKLEYPGLKGWMLVIVLSLVPYAIGQVVKTARALPKVFRKD
jgi:Ca2+-transporting ATPase